MLADYAAGGLSEGFSLLVATHLTYCPACRREVARAEALGGALLAEGSAEIAGRSPSLDAVLARIAVPEDPAPVRLRPATGSVLPVTLQDRFGADEDGLPWKFRMPGLYECVLDGFEDESVSLLRARPGTGMFAHTHRGEEATLILSGTMKDGDRLYRRGDVALADDRDDHRPEIVGDETCICLIVVAGRLHFTGRFSRMLNLFQG